MQDLSGIEERLGCVKVANEHAKLKNQVKLSCYTKLLFHFSQLSWLHGQQNIYWVDSCAPSFLYAWKAASFLKKTDQKSSLYLQLPQRKVSQQSTVSIPIDAEVVNIQLLLLHKFFHLKARENLIVATTKMEQTEWCNQQIICNIKTDITSFVMQPLTK